MKESTVPHRLWAARLALAAGVSAAICLTAWLLAPRTLTGQIDIVGYPTFFDFDFRPALWSYRIWAVLFPILTITVFVLVGRYGPARRRHTGSTPTDRIWMLNEGGIESDSRDANDSYHLVAVRLAIPALLIVYLAGTRTGRLDAIALGAGVAYVLGVLIAARAWNAIRRDGYRRSLAFANGVAASAAVLLGLWFVSRHTSVFTPDGSERAFPWLPMWLCLGLLGIVLGWTGYTMAKGTDPRTVERRLLVCVVGAAAVFFATSKLPGLGYYNGDFDDAQQITGAHLLDQGLMPWRDFVAIHGMWMDVLSGTVSFGLFGDTIWAGIAGHQAVLVPLCWVSLYLFTAWLTRANPWFGGLVFVAAVSGVFAAQIRFLLVPIALLVLGETLRRRSRVWCAGLVLLLFGQAVLVPETCFLVIPVLAVIVAADWLQRPAGSPLLPAFRRSLSGMATGLAACALFAVWLHSRDALHGFVDYYRFFGPGHNMSGATPPTEVSAFHWVAWCGIVALVFGGIVLFARQALRRQPWTPRDWMALAAAGFLAIYAEKALGRFDGYHIDHVVAVALPLAIYVLWRGLTPLTVMVASLHGRSIVMSAAAALCTALLVVASPAVFSLLERAPLQHRLLALPDPDQPRLSYAERVATDRAHLAALETALRKYAGDTEPVFDMTNRPGIVHYLLDRRPATRFFHISMAVTPYAQRTLIDELRSSRPPVVLFESTTPWAANWDGIASNVRHYEVSQYVLDNWVPVERVGTTLLMLRRDLATGRAQAIPDELWFGGRHCDWGASASFLPSQPQGPALRVPVTPVAKAAYTQASGWAADEAGRPAKEILLVVNGKTVTAARPTYYQHTLPRESRFLSRILGFRLASVTESEGDVALYLMGPDEKAHLVGWAERKRAWIERDGRRIEVGEPAQGEVTQLERNPMSIGRLETPPGVNLTDFGQAGIAPVPPGRSQIIITDDLRQAHRQISATSVPNARPDIAIRVGSCPQWHGYDGGKPLYVLHEGDAPVEVRLSRP